MHELPHRAAANERVPSSYSSRVPAVPEQRDRLEQVVRGPLPSGWSVTYTASTMSTQDLARAAARSGAPSRSVFVADYQRAGRGRQGRQWVAAPGSALLASFLFREDGPEPQPHFYTRLVSVALAEAVERVAPVSATIKWPNDLMLGDRKVAGVLAEAAWDGERLAVVVGAGTNVRGSRAAMYAVSPTATSLEAESGVALDRGDLLLALLDRLSAWDASDHSRLFDAWQTRLWGKGQTIRVRDADGAGVEERDVVVLGARPDGSLHVRLPDGSERFTATAELIL